MNKIKVLLQMSLILIWGGRTSVVRIARMAGQYAKPRSKPTEVIDGKEYTAFRGKPTFFIAVITAIYLFPSL